MIKKIYANGKDEFEFLEKMKKEAVKPIKRLLLL